MISDTENRGYTQETFAEKVGCSLNFLAQVEGPSTTRGISLVTLFKMCDVLGIQPGALLDNDDKKLGGSFEPPFPVFVFKSQVIARMSKFLEKHHSST